MTQTSLFASVQKMSHSFALEHAGAAVPMQEAAGGEEISGGVERTVLHSVFRDSAELAQSVHSFLKRPFHLPRAVSSFDALELAADAPLLPPSSFVTFMETNEESPPDLLGSLAPPCSNLFVEMGEYNNALVSRDEWESAYLLPFLQATATQSSLIQCPPPASPQASAPTIEPVPKTPSHASTPLLPPPPPPPSSSSSSVAATVFHEPVNQERPQQRSVPDLLALLQIDLGSSPRQLSAALKIHTNITVGEIRALRAERRRLLNKLYQQKSRAQRRAGPKSHSD
eukprot:m.99156 g.99156  ORF g.99156 m.99156 type:complete len:284 (+) comp14027_c0_seq5:1063-1914(+)